MERTRRQFLSASAAVGLTFTGCPRRRGGATPRPWPRASPRGSPLRRRFRAGRSAARAPWSPSSESADLKPMTAAEMQRLRDRCRGHAADGRFELYKVSLAFDNPQGREAHGFPLDPVEKEVRQELDHATGKDRPQ